MKVIGPLFGLLLLLSLFSFPLLAQNPIPNPGFENWAGNMPNDWFANNSPTGPQPVTPSTDSHSGSLSARLEVVDFGGFPFPPQIAAGTGGSGFTVSQRHATLTGYYKFTPQSGDFFHVFVEMWSGIGNGTLVGAGIFSDSTAKSGWTQFSIPISYFTGDTPDTCFLLIEVGAEQVAGGVALVDDLEFSGISAIEITNNNQLPEQFSLKQNYPNPFNPSTTIEFSIPEAAEVHLAVYNPLGEKVADLINENLPAGSYTAKWDAENLPGGIYFYRLTAGEFVQTRKMILLQ